MEDKYLGYMNGWIDTPEIVQKCRDLGHKPEEERLKQCPLKEVK